MSKDNPKAPDVIIKGENPYAEHFGALSPDGSLESVVMIDPQPDFITEAGELPVGADAAADIVKAALLREIPLGFIDEPPQLAVTIAQMIEMGIFDEVPVAAETPFWPAHCIIGIGETE